MEKRKVEEGGEREGTGEGKETRCRGGGQEKWLRRPVWTEEKTAGGNQKRPLDKKLK